MLTAYDRSQLEAYVRRHLAYVGCAQEVFSGGCACLVNKVCTSSLIYGCQNGRRIINDHMVRLVIQGELE